MRYNIQGLLRASASRQAALLIAAAALLAAGPLAAGAFPDTVSYHGDAVDAAGDPLAGTFSMTFRYFDDAGRQLLAETQDAVEVVAGRFRTELGTGAVAEGGSYTSLEALFAEHPEVELEVTVGGVVYEPRQSILPSGHSLKSRLVAAGLRAAVDDDPHWKHYEATGPVTAVQSAVLAPRGTHPEPPAAEGHVWRRPYTLPVIGPRLSRPVSELPPAERRPIAAENQEVNPPRHETLYDERGRRFGTAGPKEDDRLAGAAAVSATRTPSLSFSFEGINNINGVLPPDTEGTVGPNHYIQVVNLSFAIYDKSGSLITGPVNTSSLWSGFGGPCQSSNDGDAIFLYDQQADRFVLTQFAVSGSNSVCWAVSQTSDPTGAYYLYEVVTPRFPDYYKVGVWPAANNNAYFFGTNSGSQGAYDVFAVDRANMLAGAAARPMQFFQSFPNLLMPADSDGPVGPPSASPGLFYSFRDGGESYFGSPSSDSIDIYEFDVDWNTPANSTLTLAQVITPAQGLANFNWTVCGFFVSNCIPQPGTSQGIDSASWWPMQRLVYRNFGSHETLVGTWTVDVNATGNRAAPRWFELRDTGSGWTIFQQGTHSPDSIHRWMPSIAMDGSGNIALGYSRGNGSNFASLYYTVHDSTDPLGTMQTEQQLFAGSGSQTHSAARWGDYSSMELDPADDCTFWYTNEYLATTSSASWRTRVGVFTIPGCGGPVNNPPVVTITSPANGSTHDVGTSVSFAGTASDVEDGSLSASLAWTSSIDGSIGSGASFSTSGLSLGSHLITASVTDSGGAPGSDSITVNIVDPNSNGPQTAVYNGSLGAPACAIAGSSCDSLSLLDGRDSVGPEPNQPNTLDGCADGTSGSYHSDESNDRIVVSTLDSSDFVEGATVQIQATVYAWNTGSADSLDLYYAADANNPSWTFITTLGTPTGGLQTLSASYTLPTGTLQAVRAQFRYQGSASSCTSGSYNDHDDLVFAVKPASGNNAPVVTITAPAGGSTFTEGDNVSFAGTATDVEDGNISGDLSWTSSIDGSIGSGASFSTTSLSVGSHTITASVTDSGGASDDDQISITVNPAGGGCSGCIDWSTTPTVSFATQDVSSNVTIEDGGDTIFLQQNTWRRTTQTFVVTANTVVEFDFESTSEGEIHGIGFDEDNTLSSNRIFKVYGTQSYGIQDFDNYSGSGFTTYQIPVGQYFTGSAMYLVLVNDKDSGTLNNNSRFRNVRVFEAGGGSCTVDNNFESGATGWVNGAAATCTTGDFVLGTPTQQSNGGVTTQVGGDHTTGSGNALFTATNTAAGTNDVDGGECILESPVWNVSNASTFSTWYFHGQRDQGGDPGGDYFVLELSINGGAFSPVVSIGDVTSQAAWTLATSQIPASSTVQLRLRVSDGPSTGDLVEGGIDDLSICDN